MDPEELVDHLLTLHPTCRVCGGPSETVRQQSNPEWGLDADGRPRTEITEWLAEVHPDEITGVCLEHLKVARRASGGWHEPAAPRSASNWMERRKDEKASARTALIEALGGKCQGCSGVFPEEEMRVLVPERSRHQFGITSKAEWWRFIARQPRLLEQANLLCISCGPAKTSDKPQRLSARQRVVQAYGGRCWEPECDQTEGLLVSALPGTPALRWPNGDKYNPSSKLNYLIRNGFPPGWALSCSRHLRALQGGGYRAT